MHEIDMSNGRANICYTGQRSAIWHGLGQELEVGTPLEVWVKEAGLDWEVKSADVKYSAEYEGENAWLGPVDMLFKNRKVLYRSDNKAPLSVVSDDFKVVQPREVIEFFRDLVERNNMQLSTAGSLFDGRRFWALAELGKDFEVVQGDKVTGYLLLTTAVDGSLNTTAKFVSTRVVCNNTLTIALNSTAEGVVKVSHRAEWDPDQVKVDMGLIDESWANFITNTRKLAATKVSQQQAYDFFKELIVEDLGKEFNKLQERKVDDMMALYNYGAGHQLGKDTLWNAVNAVTEAYTHGTGRRNASHQFWDAMYGFQNKLKDAAMVKALAMTV